MPMDVDRNSRVIQCYQDKRINGRQRVQIKYEDAQSVEICLEVGHKAVQRSRPTGEGFTHDWVVYVRDANHSNINIQHIVDKVEFHLHDSFPKPRRIVKAPPYEVAETGYGGFQLPIDVFLRNTQEPKKIRLDYNMYLGIERQVIHCQYERIVFKNPSLVFHDRLLNGGGRVVRNMNTIEIADDIETMERNETKQSTTKNRNCDEVSSNKSLHVQRVGLHCRVALTDTQVHNKHDDAIEKRILSALRPSCDVVRNQLKSEPGYSTAPINRHPMTSLSRVEAANKNWDRLHADLPRSTASLSNNSRHVTFMLDNNDVISISGGSLSVPDDDVDYQQTMVAKRGRGRPRKADKKSATMTSQQRVKRVLKTRQPEVRTGGTTKTTSKDKSLSLCRFVDDKENVSPIGTRVVTVGVVSRGKVMPGLTPGCDITVMRQQQRKQEQHQQSRDSDGLQRQQSQHHQSSSSRKHPINNSIGFVSTAVAQRRDVTLPEVAVQQHTVVTAENGSPLRHRESVVTVQPKIVDETSTAECQQPCDKVDAVAPSQLHPVKHLVTVPSAAHQPVYAAETAVVAAIDRSSSPLKPSAHQPSTQHLTPAHSSKDEDIDNYFDKICLPDFIGNPLLSSTPIKVPQTTSSSTETVAQKPRGARMRYKPPTTKPRPFEDDEDGERMSRDELERLIADGGSKSRPQQSATSDPVIYRYTTVPTVTHLSPTSALVPSGSAWPIHRGLSATSSADVKRYQLPMTSPPAADVAMSQPSGPSAATEQHEHVAISSLRKRCRDNEPEATSSFPPNKRQAVDAQPASSDHVTTVGQLQQRKPERRRAPNGVPVEKLLQLQRKLSTLTNIGVLRRIVHIIGETGRYLVNEATFDFDLCNLDAVTVNRLIECIDCNGE